MSIDFGRRTIRVMILLIVTAMSTSGYGSGRGDVKKAIKELEARLPTLTANSSPEAKTAFSNEVERLAASPNARSTEQTRLNFLAEKIKLLILQTESVSSQSLRPAMSSLQSTLFSLSANREARPESIREADQSLINDFERSVLGNAKEWEAWEIGFLKSEADSHPLLLTELLQRVRNVQLSHPTILVRLKGRVKEEIERLLTLFVLSKMDQRPVLAVTVYFDIFGNDVDLGLLKQCLVTLTQTINGNKLKPDALIDSLIFLYHLKKSPYFYNTLFFQSRVEWNQSLAHPGMTEATYLGMQATSQRLADAWAAAIRKAFRSHKMSHASLWTFVRSIDELSGTDYKKIDDLLECFLESLLPLLPEVSLEVLASLCAGLRDIRVKAISVKRNYLELISNAVIEKAKHHADPSPSLLKVATALGGAAYPPDPLLFQMNMGNFSLDEVSGLMFLLIVQNYESLGDAHYQATEKIYDRYISILNQTTAFTINDASTYSMIQSIVDAFLSGARTKSVLSPYVKDQFEALTRNLRTTSSPGPSVGSSSVHHFDVLNHEDSEFVTLFEQKYKNYHLKRLNDQWVIPELSVFFMQELKNQFVRNLNQRAFPIDLQRFNRISGMRLYFLDYGWESLNPKDRLDYISSKVDPLLPPLLVAEEVRNDVSLFGQVEENEDWIDSETSSKNAEVIIAEDLAIQPEPEKSSASSAPNAKEEALDEENWIQVTPRKREREHARPKSVDCASARLSMQEILSLPDLTGPDVQDWIVDAAPFVSAFTPEEAWEVLNNLSELKMRNINFQLPFAFVSEISRKSFINLPATHWIGWMANHARIHYLPAPDQLEIWLTRTIPVLKNLGPTALSQAIKGLAILGIPVESSVLQPALTKITEALHSSAGNPSEQRRFLWSYLDLLWSLAVMDVENNLDANFKSLLLESLESFLPALSQVEWSIQSDRFRLGQLLTVKSTIRLLMNQPAFVFPASVETSLKDLKNYRKNLKPAGSRLQSDVTSYFENFMSGIRGQLASEYWVDATATPVDIAILQPNQKPWIVEVDGPHHFIFRSDGSEKLSALDELKTKLWQAAGFRVSRIDYKSWFPMNTAQRHSQVKQLFKNENKF